MDALQVLKTFVLGELVRIQDECLAYHHGTAKDIVLLEAQKLVPKFALNSVNQPPIIQGPRLPKTKGNRDTPRRIEW